MAIKYALFATAALALTPASAEAAVIYDFVIAPILGSTGQPLSNVDSRTFKFTIGAAETPTASLQALYPNFQAHSYSYAEFGSSTPVVVPATSGKNIAFADALSQGGLSLTNSGVRNFFVYNTVLYDDTAYKLALLTNAAAQPSFLTGTYLVSTTPWNNNIFNTVSRPQDNYTVTISSRLVGPVPEPEIWATMFTGFVVTGIVMRRRSRRQMTMRLA